MSDSDESAQDVSIVVGIDEGDAETLDRDVRVLRDELRRLNVERVSPVAEIAPEGARAVDAAVIGALIVQVVPVLEHLSAIVATVRQWVAGRRLRTASITIDGDRLEISGANQENLNDLIRLFVGRHSKGAE